MKRLLLGIFALLVVSFSFGQRLWVTDSYIKVQNPVSGETNYLATDAIVKVYVKGSNISLFTSVPSQDFTIKYGDITTYNDGAVPSQSVIVSDIQGALESSGFTKYYSWASAYLINTTRLYYIPTPKGGTWSFFANITKNDDSTSFIPMTRLKGLMTLYPGLDTITTTTTTTISWDDIVATGDTVVIKGISTDTTRLNNEAKVQK